MRVTPFSCGTALVLLVAYPVAELVALVEMTVRHGPAFTLLWVLAAAAAGFVVLRLEGQDVAAFNAVRVALRRGEPPEVPLFATLLRTAGAVLLIIPGPLSDAIGVLLVFRPIARFIARRFASGPGSLAPSGPPGPGAGPRPPTIEGEVIGRRYVDEAAAAGNGAGGGGGLQAPPEKG